MTMLISTFCQQYKIHCSYSYAKTQKLKKVETCILFLHKISPNISPNIYKITCNKSKNVNFNCFSKLAKAQAKNYSNQSCSVNKCITTNSLEGTKLAFKKNTNITHFTWNFMSKNCHNYRNKLIWISGSEAYTNSKSIKEIMYQFRYHYQVSRAVFSFQLLATIFLFYILLNSLRINFCQTMQKFIIGIRKFRVFIRSINRVPFFFLLTINNLFSIQHFTVFSRISFFMTIRFFLTLMLMFSTLIMCLISPVFVCDTAAHKESFYKNERKNSNYKDQ